jgi:hypothetical protein
MRFKTKAEFIKDYGDNWSSRVCWNPQGKMDYLFGARLDDEAADALHNYGRVSISDTNPDRIFERHTWSVFRNMVTDAPTKFELHRKALCVAN